MLCFLLAEQFSIGSNCCILDLRQHLTDGLDEIPFKPRCNQGDEINEVAPVRIVGIALEGNGFAETKIDLADFNGVHRMNFRILTVLATSLHKSFQGAVSPFWMVSFVW